MIFSGMTLQAGFHMGSEHNPHGNIAQVAAVSYEQMTGFDSHVPVFGISYYNWSFLHKISIVCFSLCVLYHIHFHWGWFRCVFKNRMTGRNVQVITLSFLFLAVAFTGLVPWCINLVGGAATSRLLFIEIHDKLTLLLIIYLVLHVIKRAFWYRKTFETLRRKI
jgi:hypothetical protein